MFGDVVLKNAGVGPPTKGALPKPGEIRGGAAVAGTPPNAAKLPITGVCIDSGTCWEFEVICVKLGFCTLSAFIEGAGADVLFVLLDNKLSKSSFKLPAFKLSAQVAPTCVDVLLLLLFDVLPSPVVNDDCCELLLLLALTGCSRVLPVGAIGGSILSKK